MATFWTDPKGGDGTLWQLLEGTTDLYFACVGIDGDDDRVYAWKASDGTFHQLAFEGQSNYTAKTSSYTLLETDTIVEFTITSDAVATLPDPTGIEDGKRYSIINHYSSTRGLTFSRPINGNDFFILSPEESIDIYSNGTEYVVD